MKELCLMLELKDDADLVREYERHHKPGNVWPEVVRSIRESGIRGMRIYRSGKRLTMIMSVEDSFDPAARAAADASSPRVVEWERMMETFQDMQRVDDPAQKWRTATCIFDLSEHTG